MGFPRSSRLRLSAIAQLPATCGDDGELLTQPSGRDEEHVKKSRGLLFSRKKPISGMDRQRIFIEGVFHCVGAVKKNRNFAPTMAQRQTAVRNKCPRSLP